MTWGMLCMPDRLCHAEHDLGARFMAAHEPGSGMLESVTGASSGIGWALAQQLAQDGARLLVTARRGSRLEQLREQLRARGVEVHCVTGDIARGNSRRTAGSASAASGVGWMC